MTTSLVTGGSGFIGQHLVEQLLADGGEVRILDLEAPPVRRPGVTFIRGSVTDSKLVAEAMEGVRFAYHTAAIPHLWIADPTLFDTVNVNGTRVVFEAAVKAGVERIVHTSSAVVLADRVGKPRQGTRSVVRDERHQTRLGDLPHGYARSKWRAERLALSYGDRLAVVVVMPTLPLGPGDRHMTPPARMLSDFVTGSIQAYADCVLNIIDVRDVATGHRLACRYGRPGRRYLLNQHSMPMAGFLEHLENVAERPMPRWRIPSGAALAFSALLEVWSTLVSGRPPMAPLAGTRLGLRPIAFDGQRAQTELGLPMTPLVKTLSDAVAWLADHHRLSGDSGRQALVFDNR